MIQASFQPPRGAVWLIELFAPYEQAESIPGDLLEEFSDLASKSGVAYARGWYWRQSVRTIFHLIRSGFRVAPWSIAGVVLGGILLVQVGHALAEWAIATGIEKFVNHRVLPYHLLSRPALLSLSVNIGMYLCRLTVAMLIGCIIALACKRREMLATITVSLVCSIQAVVGFLNSVHGWKDYKVLPWVLLYSFGGLFAIVVGGVIVRRYRFRSPRPA
jgi:hypothetical protein